MANVKAVIFLSILAAAGIYFLFGDISMFGSMEDFMQFLIDVLNGTRGGTTLVAVSALTPIADIPKTIVKVKITANNFFIMKPPKM